MTISIRESYRGKHVMVTGTTGFLGKVFMAMLLDRLDVGRVYVLVRKKGLRPVQKRFEKVVGTSPVFQPLHEKHGADFGAWLSERVEVVEGDISSDSFGIAPEVLQRLRKDLDVVVNCAGLVDFNPDVRQALSSNVDGALNAAELVAGCDNAALVHVSTCYVVGKRSGRIAEEITWGYTPTGQKFDPQVEIEEIAGIVDSVLATQDTPEAEAELTEEVLALIRQRGLDEGNATLVRNMTHRQRQQRVKQRMTVAGEARAETWGWPNTYTWSKSIGEQLLQRRAKELGIRWCVLRPSVVESAAEFPFPGWNEGFNTCGPLVYLLGTWFRHLPSKVGHPFDIVPVDLVCKGLLTVGAAAMLGVQREVYHCGTSDRNVFTVDRATELTSLGHRQHLRKHGETAIERLVLSRWDARSVDPDSMFTMKQVRRTTRGLESLLRKVSGRAPAAMKERAEKLADGVHEADKGLKQIEKVCDLFKPFIHDNRWVFETDNLVSHRVHEEDLAFRPTQLHWRTWWIEVHMPGLRKWCLPHMQGKPVPTYTPKHPFRLQLKPAAARPAASQAG